MIQVIERFHKILEYVSREPAKSCRLGELAGYLGISPSACGNIVRTMVELGYLRQEGPRCGYLPGPANYILALNSPFHHLSCAARPEMEALTGRHNHQVVLVSECGGCRQEILRLTTDAQISISPRGQKSTVSSLFRYSTGMVLLSYMDETRVKHLWLRDNGSSNLLGVSDYREFRKRCAAIAAKGEVVNMSDLPPGGTPEDTVFTMAVPIRCRGAVIAALGICFTAADDPAKAIDGCRHCAERISRLIS